jgi:pre-rRNA-processing protein TSR4
VLSLLLQLNGDLPDWFPGHERRLYVLGCRRKACRRKEGSVRAIRVVRVSEVEDKTKEEQKVDKTENKMPDVNLGEKLFGVQSPTPAQANPLASSKAIAGANPFAATGSSSPNPFSTAAQPEASAAPSKTTPDGLAETFAQKARISASPSKSPMDSAKAPPEPWPSDPKPYANFHLDADKEYLDPTFGSDEAHPQTRVETNGEGSSSSAQEDKVLFESAMDKTFQRFADRLAQNPEQVLRYEFAGQPLLYSKTDAVGKVLAPAMETKVQTASLKGATSGSQMKIPRCPNCGAGRVFESQLSPHAITELEADEVAIDGMEWGTIIVGVCSDDCPEKGTAKGDAGYLEEWVGVQWEEVADHRSQ